MNKNVTYSYLNRCYLRNKKNDLLQNGGCLFHTFLKDGLALGVRHFRERHESREETDPDWLFLTFHGLFAREFEAEPILHQEPFASIFAIVLDMSVNSFVNVHNPHGEVPGQIPDGDLVGCQFRQFKEPFFVALKEMTRQDMYFWNTFVSPFDDIALAVIKQDQQVATQDRSKGVFLIEVDDILVIR